MKSLRVAVMGLAIVFTNTVVLFAADVKEELGKIKGTWSLKSRFSSGSEFKQAKALQIEVKIDGDQWTVFMNGKANDAESIVIDPNKSPKTIDRSNKTSTQKGIYKLDGQTLTVAFGPPNGPRPDKFESPKDSSVSVSVYNRKK